MAGPRRWSVLAAGLLAAACTGDVEEAPPPDGGIVSDAPAWSVEAARLAADEPLVRIGAWVDGGETFDRIQAARFVAPDRIAVADRTTVAVRVFDLDGRLATVVGREGDGPGEFRSADHVEGRGDTIVVADRRLGRVSRFDPSGRLLDVTSLPQDLRGVTRVVGLYPDGDFLLERSGVGSRAVTRAGPLPPDSTTWYRLDPDAGEPTALASAVAMEGYGHEWAGMFALGEVTFGARAHAALDGDTLLVASGQEGFQVERIGPAGGSAGWFGTTAEPVPTTDADVARYVEWRLDNAPSNADTDGWRRVLEDAPVRASFPPTGAVLVDDAGRTWVQHFRVLDAAERWSVFDRTRRWLGDVILPDRTRLMDVAQDRLVAAHRDDLGVETLVLYAWSPPDDRRGAGP